jgi:ubiquinone/menaquinone biosynthesis C-methylase UbiE
LRDPEQAARRASANLATGLPATANHTAMSSPIDRNQTSSQPSEPQRAGIQENVNTHFDAAAGYWDEIYRDGDLQSVIYQRRQAAVLDFVAQATTTPDARVLEIGCGAGHLTAQLAARYGRVDAVDSSAAMVELAARQAQQAGLGERVSVAQADVHALPFASGEFDLVVAVGVIPWLHSPADAVAEMARVLRAGGQLVLTADNGARLSSFTDPRGLLALTPLRRAYHAMRNNPGQAVSHLHFPRAVNRFVERAGLRVVAHRTIGFGPLSLVGRPLLTDAAAVRLSDRLQALADAGVPGLRGTGWHYLLRAVKI